MRLHRWKFDYIRAGLTNFGDELNNWLWPRLLPGAFDDDSSTVFCGFGTILGLPAPQAKRILIFSSGCGYGQRPRIAKNWTIYCVRGPLTANVLGLDPQYGVCDGAILVRRVYQPTGDREGIGYMPHISEAMRNGRYWEAVCRNLGLRYLDPSAPVEDCLRGISSVGLLISEAMHGAIVADALRVPWVPVATNARILAFKWRDWLSTVGLKYRPHRMLVRHFRTALNKFVKSAPVRNRFMLPLMERFLRNVIRNGQPQLSDERVLELRTQQLEERLALLQKTMNAERR